MAQPCPRACFHSTHWLLVEQARDAESTARREALGALVSLYWPALRAHLVINRRLSPETADDLLQDFAADRVLAQRFLAHVDRAKGRFRSFLLRCLENYRIDHCRGRKEAIRLDEAQQKQIPARGADSPDISDVLWAKQVIHEALRRMWDSCRRRRRSAIWTIFELRVLCPTLFNAPVPSYGQLVAKLGLAPEQQAANALVTAKRQFRRTLEVVVGEYIKDDNEVQAEIIELRVILSVAGDEGVPDEGVDEAQGNSAAIEFPCAISGSVSAKLPVNLGATNLSLLARLFGVSARRDAEWESFDLKSRLTRLLATPLLHSLPGIDPRALVRNSRWFGLARPDTITLRDVFFDPRPPIELLCEIKNEARRLTRMRNPQLPRNLASLLYFAAIAAAQIRRGLWISTLDPEMIQQGANTLVDEPWVVEPVRGVLQRFVGQNICAAS